MKVICIEEPKTKFSHKTGLPFVVRVGSVYTVAECLTLGDVPGYRLKEDMIHTYAAKWFEPLSEIDETEMERNYNKETAY
jgi:hypothetical protein